jgi:hypothetical protein
MPPATTTTSAPVDLAIGQLVPNGPRRPSTAPCSLAQIACVTAPTARTVRTTGPSRSGGPLTESGTSPTPKTYAIMNWPGATEGPTPSTASSTSVHVSEVSAFRSRTT